MQAALPIYLMIIYSRCLGYDDLAKRGTKDRAFLWHVAREAVVFRGCLKN